MSTEAGSSSSVLEHLDRDGAGGAGGERHLHDPGCRDVGAHLAGVGPHGEAGGYAQARVPVLVGEHPDPNRGGHRARSSRTVRVGAGSNWVTHAVVGRRRARRRAGRPAGARRG